MKIFCWDDGKVYGTGNSVNGQLGRSTNTFVFTQITSLPSTKIVSVGTLEFSSYFMTGKSNDSFVAM